MSPEPSSGSAVPVMSVNGNQSSYKLPGQDSDPYVQPHALWLGAQRAGASTGNSYDNMGVLSSVVLRGHPDGFMDLGCLYCAVMTNSSVMDSRAGLSSNLTDAANIANDPSFDTVVDYQQTSNFEPVLSLDNVTYDSTHIYLPSGSYLTAQQIARIHPNMYVTTNSIASDVIQTEIRTTDSGVQNPTSGLTLNNHNYYVSTVAGVADDGSYITVNGWGVQNGNSTGHKWRSGDVPTSIYDTVRSNFGHAVAMIGSPTQTGGRNIYMTYDPVANPHSLIDYFNADEIDVHYNGDKSNEATQRGLVISYDCEGDAAPNAGTCYHPTYDSVGLIINGQNLPNGIQNTVSGWANEYKGYNFYIPGSQAPEIGKAHTSFESFTPSTDNHQIVTRSWVEQSDSSASPAWTQYRVNIGAVIDGTRWDSSASTGSKMGMVSFDYSLANLGGVCLVGNSAPSGDTPGMCVRGDGGSYFGNYTKFYNDIELEPGKPLIAQATVNEVEQHGATLSGDANGDWVVGTQIAGGANVRGINGLYTNTITSTVSNIPYIQGVALVRTNDTSQTLTSIKAATHSPSDRVFCGDCLNSGQGTGNGSGRWIFMDNKNTWRSEDGLAAQD